MNEVVLVRKVVRLHTVIAIAPKVEAQQSLRASHLLTADIKQSVRKGGVSPGAPVSELCPWESLCISRAPTNGLPVTL